MADEADDMEFGRPLGCAERQRLAALARTPEDWITDAVTLPLTPPFGILLKPGDTGFILKPLCVFRPKTFVITKLARKGWHQLVVVRLRIGNEEVIRNHTRLCDLHRNSTLLMPTIQPQPAAPHLGQGVLIIRNPTDKAIRLALDVEGIGARKVSR